MPVVQTFEWCEACGVPHGSVCALHRESEALRATLADIQRDADEGCNRAARHHILVRIRHRARTALASAPARTTFRNDK